MDFKAFIAPVYFGHSLSMLENSCFYLYHGLYWPDGFTNNLKRLKGEK